MKTTFLLIVFCVLWISIAAQTPQAFKYQAVARDASGNVLANRSVSFRISILSGGASGTAVYIETHTGKTTNAFGLVDLEIGNGTPSSGTFSSIPWSTGSYYVKVEMDPNGGSSFTAMGTSQLLSVPYALYAKDVQNKDDADADPTNEIQTLSISGTVLTLSKGGGSVTLPSSGGGDNWGTQVVVTDGTLSGNGTTATPLKVADNGITSAKILDGTIATADLANLAVTADKLAANSVTTDKINAGAVTGAKIAQASATTGQVLKWNGTTWAPANDATGTGLTLPYSGTATSSYNNPLLEIINSGEGTGIVGKTASSSGGTGVLGWAPSESGENYGVLGEADSPSGVGVYGIGGNKGIWGNTSSGTGVVGESDSKNGTGVQGLTNSPTGINYGVHGISSSVSGYGVYGESPNYGVYGTSTATTGNYIGVSGVSASSSGTGVSGLASSDLGTTIGVLGNVASSDGYSGFFTGGKFYISGRTGIGTQSPSAGLHLKGSGFPESFMYIESNTGQDAGLRLYEGSTAKWHIFNSSGAGGLQIYNSGTVTAIFCRQSDSNVGIGTTTPGYKLQVGNAGDGTQARANAWNLLSDARLKKNFAGLKNPLDMVEKLNGYYFYWNTGTDQTRQVGFSAQEVQKVIPEIVSKGEDGYLSIEYGKMAPLLLEAIKELKAENDILKSENGQQQSRIESLESRLSKLESMLEATSNK